MTLKVFKFGGASVKDAASVRNVASVLKRFPADRLIVVVSAMGKITNALEKLTDAFVLKKGDTKAILEEIKKYHFDIVKELFSDPSHPVYKEVQAVFLAMEKKLNSTSSDNYNKEYDQLVSQGEILSSRIVSAYLDLSGVKNKWLDVREVIRTDDTYREGKVDWEKTADLTPNPSPRGEGNIAVTQGFLGRTKDGFTTTLGREGSDYTAAILA